MQKKLIITGASGFIASEFLKKNKNLNFEIFLVSRKQPKNIGNIKFKKLDLRDYNQTKKYFEFINPNIVLHLADTKNRKNFTNEDIEKLIVNDDNIVIAENLIRACCKLPILEKFIHIGTCDEYGDSVKKLRESAHEKPIKYYGKYKLDITKRFLNAFSKYKFPVIIIRPSVIYGKDQGDEMFIPSLIKSLKRKTFFHMSSGEQYRDFLHIDDFIDGLFKILICEDKKILGEKFNLSYGKSYKLRKIIEISKKVFPVKKDIIKLNSKNISEELVMNYFIDNNKSRKYFNWYPKISITMGIKSFK